VPGGRRGFENKYNLKSKYLKRNLLFDSPPEYRGRRCI
jgi:hypothetical protein